MVNYPFQYLARLYGKSVYKILKINPIERAENLKLRRDNIDSPKALLKRVIELHFCSPIKKKPIVFCHELVMTMGKHVEEGKRFDYIATVKAKYPTLFKAAESIIGVGNEVEDKFDKEEIMNLPVLASDIDDFGTWLIKVILDSNYTKDMFIKNKKCKENNNQNNNHNKNRNDRTQSQRFNNRNNHNRNDYYDNNNNIIANMFQISTQEQQEKKIPEKPVD